MMVINRSSLLRAMLKRMPSVKFYDMMYFVNAIIELIIKRILEDKVVIVDGFGILTRTKSKPRRAYNVSKREYQTIVSNSVAFRPHHALLKMVELTGEDFLKEVIRKKSIQEVSSRKKRKKLV